MSTKQPAPKSKLSPLNSFIFASRWLQLPLYLGLIAAQAVYVFHFWVELVHLLEAAFGNQAALQALINSIGYKAANMAYTETFGVPSIPVRSGGSIPIVALFEKELKSKTILMGFGLDSDAIHSPNEHFGIFNYLKGIETIPLFYKYFVELSK